MAPLTQAVVSSFLEERDGVSVYHGEVDKLWTIVAVPNGGYALGLVVSACVASQAQKRHTDILHVTAHFLRVTSMGSYQVHIRSIRSGASFAYLTAELIQKNEVKILAQFIFKASSVQPPAFRTSILPPSPYARRIPLHLHPSVAPITPMFGETGFKNEVRWAEDKAIRERNRALGRGEGPAVGGGGLEWGAWFELLDPTENITVATLPFLGDMFKTTPALLPKDERPPISWNPTLVLSLEYKSKIPDDPQYSKRTVGLYSCGKFLHDGQHDVSVEIWTAPSDIGEGAQVDGWRDNQVCLGIASQTALTVPMSVNERKAAQANGKSKL